jgi:hypothetical protein
MKNICASSMTAKDVLTVIVVGVCLPVLVPWVLIGHLTLYIIENARRHGDHPRGHGRVMAYTVALALGPMYPILVGAAAMRSLRRKCGTRMGAIRARLELARARRDVKRVSRFLCSPLSGSPDAQVIASAVRALTDRDTDTRAADNRALSIFTLETAIEQVPIEKQANFRRALRVISEDNERNIRSVH